MSTHHLHGFLVAVGLLAGCAASQKPFDQMTAQEHRSAAARENDLADRNFARISGEHIRPPANGTLYDETWVESPDLYDVGSTEYSIAWSRISDPDEKYEDAASKHRENALRHERAADALEGRPSSQPLPPPQPPLIPPDRG